MGARRRYRRQRKKRRTDIRTKKKPEPTATPMIPPVLVLKPLFLVEVLSMGVALGPRVMVLVTTGGEVTVSD